MEGKWLRDCLFSGMTANAFKLSTVLNMGWFWSRVSGCSVLYRGVSIETLDFDNLLAVAAPDACEIKPPGYVEHESNSTYFYIVRRVNSCGMEEQTLDAAVKVSIGADGELADAQPNSIFSAKVQQIEGDRVELVWFYWPLGQASEPFCFNIYTDGGTGQIDYQSAIAAIKYIGTRFYSYQTDALNAGTYLFAIRAEDTNGVESDSLMHMQIQLATTSPCAIDILSTDAI